MPSSSASGTSRCGLLERAGAVPLCNCAPHSSAAPAPSASATRASAVTVRGETLSTVRPASPQIVSVVPAEEDLVRARKLIFRLVLAACAATFAVTAPAAPQTHLDVVPYVGLYVPTASMVSGDSFAIPPVTQQATF